MLKYLLISLLLLSSIEGVRGQDDKKLDDSLKEVTSTVNQRLKNISVYANAIAESGREIDLCSTATCEMNAQTSILIFTRMEVILLTQLCKDMDSMIQLEVRMRKKYNLKD